MPVAFDLQPRRNRLSGRNSQFQRSSCRHGIGKSTLVRGRFKRYEELRFRAKFDRAEIVYFSRDAFAVHGRRRGNFYTRGIRCRIVSIDRRAQCPLRFAVTGLNHQRG